MESKCRAPLRVLSLGLLITGGAHAFQTPAAPYPAVRTSTTTTQLFSTQLDKEVEETQSQSTTNHNNTPLIDVSSTLNGQQSINDINLLDLSSYESDLLSAWDTDVSLQKGFDWEIEKLRRYFAGLRQTSDGRWVRNPSLFDFLVTHSPSNVVGVGVDGQRYESPPKPVNFVDVVVLVVKNLLNGIGFGPSLGMAAVPDAVIQKYEGSFFSFIKGALGGDLQTLAGGPLFLLLAKYYKDYGPIFNLSFGPKSFLVISDPVMARHILRDSSPEQYCKGMLAEILEPIMGDGLIPADPKIWKVSSFFFLIKDSFQFLCHVCTHFFLWKTSCICDRFVGELLCLASTKSG